MNKLKTRNRLLFVICVAVYMVVLLVFVFWDYGHRENRTETSGVSRTTRGANHDPSLPDPRSPGR